MSTEKEAMPNYALFGKLPGAGDFVSRRMSYRTQQFWDEWCAAGVEQLKESSPVGGWAIWRNMPSWAFLVSAQSGIPFAQLGVIAPSCDRVGRVFPLLAIIEIPEARAKAIVARAANVGIAWADAITRAQHERLGVDAFDALLQSTLAKCLSEEEAIVDAEATLPPGASPTTLPWPDLHQHFDVYSNEHYWWSVPPATTGFRAKTYRGSLTSSQFASLAM
jgi:type VI secretion system protein ImpM